RRVGVPLHLGVQLDAIAGTAGVEAVRFRNRRGEEVTMQCDAVAIGFGLKPETQLAELAGAELRYDPVFRQWLPHADLDGRCRRGVYVAGDGATVGGAQAAALTGELAACALLEDFNIATAGIDRASMRRRIARLRRFQR